jgi:hypothetical protein
MAHVLLIFNTCILFKIGSNCKRNKGLEMGSDQTVVSKHSRGVPGIGAWLGGSVVLVIE